MVFFIHVDNPQFSCDFFFQFPVLKILLPVRHGAFLGSVRNLKFVLGAQVYHERCSRFSFNIYMKKDTSDRVL